MVQTKARVMETNGSGWTAAVLAFWATIGVAILAGIKAILSHVWVPRDHVQTKILEDMQADIAALLGKSDMQAAEIACLKGTVGSQGRMLTRLIEAHDGR